MLLGIARCSTTGLLRCESEQRCLRRDGLLAELAELAEGADEAPPPQAPGTPAAYSQVAQPLSTLRSACKTRERMWGLGKLFALKEGEWDC